jgi:hypothetical protein
VDLDRSEEPAGAPAAEVPSRPLHRRVQTAVGTRLSPEGTRNPTRMERLTVRRLSWSRIVRLNIYLEIAGRAATGLWIVFLVTVFFGIHWKEVVRDAVNSGRPVQGALALVLLVPTLLFVAGRSAVGFARWRLQRELWRRDVERLTETPPPP